MTQSTGAGLTRRTALSVVGAALLSGCSDSTTSTADSSSPVASEKLSGTVKIAGSSTVYPLTLQVSEQFTERHPDASISVASTGTGGGFSGFFCQGETDINGASRPISDDERQICADNNVSFLELQVATDALTVIVNNDADWIDCVRPTELAMIWRQNGVDQWSDIREEWPDEEIERHGPSSDSGTFNYFAEKIIGDVGTHRQNYRGTEQDSTIVSNVRNSEYAIGYLGFAYYNQNKEMVKALAIDNGDQCVSPSFNTAENNTYSPLLRPLFVYVATDSLANPTIRSFITQYMGLIDTDLVSDVGYVPLSETAASRERSVLAKAVDDCEACVENIDTS